MNYLGRSVTGHVYVDTERGLSQNDLAIQSLTTNDEIGSFYYDADEELSLVD